MSSANVVLPTSNIIIEYIDLFHIYPLFWKGDAGVKNEVMTIFLMHAVSY